MAGIGGGLGAFAQAFMQARQMKMQQAQEQAQIQHEQNQDHIAALDQGLRTEEYKLARRKAGADVQLTPKQMFVNPKATPEQRAQHNRNLSAIYAAQGADDQAQKYENMAKDESTEGIRRTNEAQRFQYEYDRLHAQDTWHSQADKAKHDQIAALLKGKIISGDFSVEDALIRANAAVQVGQGHDTTSSENNQRTTAARMAGYQNQVHLESMRQLGQDSRMRFKAVTSDNFNEWKTLHTSWNQSRLKAHAAIVKSGDAVLPSGWSRPQAGPDGKPVGPDGKPVDPNSPNVMKDSSGNVLAIGPPEPISPPKFISAVQASIDAVKNAQDPHAEADRRIKNVQANQAVPAGMKPSAIKAIENAANAVRDAHTKALKRVPAPQADYSEDGGSNPYGGSEGTQNFPSSPWP